MNERSIRLLRIKFICTSILAYILAMLLMGGLTFFTNLIVTNRQMDGIMDYIIENEGELPGPEKDRDTSEEDLEEDRDTSEEDLAEILEQASQENTDMDAISVNDIFAVKESSYDNTDFFYSTRYFAVIVDRKGEIDEIIMNHIASVDEKEAERMAEKVLKHHLRFGTTRVYYFKRASISNQRSIIVFVDARNQVATNVRLLYTILAVFGFGFIIVIILVRYFSYKIIQPEIERVKRQEQFITNASHELKTPLAVIRANTEVEQMISGENEWNQSTLKQVDRMTGLIQNLVLIARSREQGDNSSYVPVDVTKAAKETVETFSSFAAQSQKHLEQEVEEGIQFKGEEGDVRQLLSLLLDNAIKYCDENGTIKVTLRKGRNCLRLCVSNSFQEGERVDCKRFFDRFYRQDESHNIEKGGYGIGLSIAESLVKKYRGSIDANWKDGVISFTCVLKEGF